MSVAVGTITTALSQALDGQKVKQAQLDTVSRNLNAVDIPGARKKEVAVASKTVGGQNVGLDISKIRRIVNMAYVGTSQKLHTDLESSKLAEDVLKRVTQIFGSPESKSAVGNLIAQFESSLETLSRSSSDGALLFKTVKSAAANLTEGLNANEKAIQGFREEVESLIDEEVRVFNGYLEELREVNIQLNNVSAHAIDYTDLLDKRDELVKQVREISGASHFFRPTEAVTLVAGDGSFDFLNNSTNPLNFSVSGKGSLTKAQTYENGSLSGISIKEATGTYRDVSTSFKTGKLAKLLELRDKFLPEMSEQLHVLAGALKEAVNKAHNPGAPIPPLSQMKSDVAITGTDFNFQAVNEPGSIRLIPDPTTGKYGVIEFALLDQTGNSIGNGCRIDLDLLKADIDAAFTSNYLLTVQDILNAVNGYYTVPQSPSAPLGAAPNGWPGAWPLATVLTNNASYAGLGVTAGTLPPPAVSTPINGPYANNEFMQFQSGKLVFGATSTVAQPRGVAINESEVTFSLDGFRDQDPGFSYPMQLNNFFVTDGSSSDAFGIKIRSDILDNPAKLSRGSLRSRLTDPLNPLTRTWSVGNADAKILLKMSEVFSQTFSFSAPGLTLPKASLEQFGTEILSVASIKADEAMTNRVYYDELVSQIDTIISQESDPNMDEELIKSVPIKEQYGALMHVIRLIQEMMDQLLSTFQR